MLSHTSVSNGFFTPKILFIYFYMFGYFVCMHVSAPYACLVLVEARRGHEIPMELQLQTVVSHCVSTGT